MKTNCAIGWSVACIALISILFCGVVAGQDLVTDKRAAKTKAKSQAKNKSKIKKFPNAAVWSDPTLAEKDFEGYRFIGEYVKDGRGLQVTPAEGRFYSSIYTGGLPGAGWDGSAIEHQWSTLESVETLTQGWQKVDRSPKVTGKLPPADALVLFDGSSTQQWKNAKVENGVLRAGCRTKESFQDFRLYLEFLVPLKPEPPISHPHRGNSGVFAVGAYEVQIADTFGLDPSPQAWQEDDMLKPVDTWCGSVYGIQAFDINMCLPPLAWQSLEIDFKAARFEDDKKVASAVMSVILNGVKVQDQTVLTAGTGGGPAGPRAEVAKGPIILQNHGNPNRFRNIWIVPRPFDAH